MSTQISYFVPLYIPVTVNSMLMFAILVILLKKIPLQFCICLSPWSRLLGSEVNHKW